MKLRLFTGLALALTLGGCTTYGYVGDGGGYYTGAPQTQYRYYGDSYGPYGYGSSYYYSPGVSFGLSYGYPYSYYQGGPYRPYYGGVYYPRPPYYSHVRPDHGHDRPDRPDHGGRPDRPPMADGNPPPLNRGPWRDIERLRRAQQGDDGTPRRQPGPGTLGYGGMGPDPAPGMVEPGLRPGGGARPVPPPGYRVSGARPPSGMAGGGNDMSGGRRMASEVRAERAERAPQRSESRASESRRDDSRRSGTPDTIEP